MVTLRSCIVVFGIRGRMISRIISLRYRNILVLKELEKPSLVKKKKKRMNIGFKSCHYTLAPRRKEIKMNAKTSYFVLF